MNAGYIAVVAISRGVRAIPHWCRCDHWKPPDYRRPPRERAWVLIAADRRCRGHGFGRAARPVTTGGTPC